jgi:hypothetical protein
MRQWVRALQDGDVRLTVIGKRLQRATEQPARVEQMVGRTSEDLLIPSSLVADDVKGSDE